MNRDPKMSLIIKRRNPAVVRILCVVGFVLVAPLLAGCMTPGERARLVQSNESLRRDNERLERTVARRDATVASLHQRIQQLQGFGPDRPADLFAPVSIEIVSRSGGVDYDDVPGDDGVTVYLRLRDKDGYVVKPAGSIAIQLLDNTNIDSPKVIGVYRFDDEATLRKSWYGRFGTGHYTLKCPFPDGIAAPRRVDVKAEFVDYLTGRTLSAVMEVVVAPPDKNRMQHSTRADKP